ncbi:MAG TPA: hypothetical protein VIZ18_06865 [Ktedonobacteraceae bacterium]
MSSPAEVQSPGPLKKRPRLSHRAKVIIALVVIGIGVVLAIFFAPPEGDSNNITGDTIPATLTVTNLVGSINVNRGADYNSVRFTVTSVQQASKFSDDHKRADAYTIRVALSVQSDKGQQSPVGIDYAAIARLQLAHGQLIAPQLVNMSPNVLPNQTYTGFIDFPVDAPVNLSSLALQLGNGSSVSFAS